MLRNRSVALAAAAAIAALLPTSATAVATPHALAAPVVLHVGQIDNQDIPPLPGSEPDTLVERDVGGVAPSAVRRDAQDLAALAAAHLMPNQPERL